MKFASKLEAALWWARKGIPVFRLHPNSKLPVAEGWQHIATTDERIIREWFDDSFHENPGEIGLLMGGQYVALDIDVKEGKGGQESFYDLILDHGPLKGTLMQQTPTGGRHIIMRTSRTLKNTVEKLGPGLDTRGHNGFVVAAGSALDGRPYELLADGEPEQCPEWLEQLIGAASTQAAKPGEFIGEMDTEQAVERAREYLVREAPEAVENAGGRSATMEAIQRVGDLGVSPPQCYELMMDHWNEQKAFPAWAPDEMSEFVDSVYHYRKKPIGCAAVDVEFEPVEQIDMGNPMSLPLAYRNIGAPGWTTKREYLVRGLLNRRMIAMLTAKSNAGKSPLALDLAVAIMRGRPWNGMKITKPRYVFHISTEGWTGLGDRMRALSVEHDIQPGEPLDYYAGSINLRTSSKDAKAIVKTVNARAAEFGLEAGLVVIDTLSHAMGGGDDSNQEHVRAVVDNVKLIKEGTGAAVLLLHHPTKSGDADYRGSSLWENDLDLLMFVEAPDRGSNGVRKLTTPRVKEYAQILPIKFGIKVLELGLDQEGDPITSVVVDWACGDMKPVVNWVGKESERWDLLVEAFEGGTTFSFKSACELLVEKGVSLTAAESAYSRILTKALTHRLVEKTNEDQYLMGIFH